MRLIIPVLSVAAVIFPLTSAAAQQAPSGSPPAATSVTESFRGISALFGSRLVSAFVSIPAGRYGYAPTPAQQTIGYVAQHLIEANYALCERFGARPRPSTARDGIADTVKAKWPKDTLVAQLRESFAFCATAMSNVDDAHLAEDALVPGAGPGVTQQRARSLLLFVTDLAEHYAQLSSYMRLLGMVPPSSLSSVRRVAIELPVSVLSRYVGTYEVPPSRQFGSPALRFDVTVRDGALLVKPVAQPEAQLWPASEMDFFLKVSNATLTFTRDAAGAVTGVVVHDNGEDRVGTKVR
jgi:uncharacterized damage-inducible protein DinB